MLWPAVTRWRNRSGRVAWLSRVAVGALTASISFSGCGAATAPTVASVQGMTISRAALAHWTRLKRIELQSSLKRASTLRPLQVERKALVFLITADWLQAEAAAQGVVATSSEVNATYEGLVSGPIGHSFVASLKRRGVSRSDELLELRLDNLSQKLETRIAAGHNSVSAEQIAAYYHTHTREFQGRDRSSQTLAAATPVIRQTLLQLGQQRLVRAFLAGYRRRWKQRTNCQPGYIVPECGDGPPLPAGPSG
jgi:hypothetical protein